MRILVIDIGGTHVKVLVGGASARRDFESGPTLTAAQMVEGVKAITKDWKYEAVSIGFPGPVVHNRPFSEPHNLGRGWVGFNFQRAFGRPVKIINDAAMQALGSYKKATYEDYAGVKALKKRGKKKWRRDVAKIVEQMMAALEPDEIVIGGGNAKKLKELPPHCRLGDNANAFLGGLRLWKQEDSVPRASRPEVRSRKN